MDAAVNEKCSRLDAVLAVDLRSGGVDGHEVGRCHLGPVEALRIDEELTRLARHCQAEVVAYALGVTEARGPAQRRRQIDARRSSGIGGRQLKSLFADICKIYRPVCGICARDAIRSRSERHSASSGIPSPTASFPPPSWVTDRR